MKISRNSRRRASVRMVAALIAASYALLAPAAASPWARDGGKFFMSTRGEYFRAAADTAAPMALGPTRFERFDSGTYGEFGLTDSITIGGKVSYGTSTYFDGFTSQTASGFSEIEGFVQKQIHRGDHGALSLKLAGAAPSRFEAGARPEIVTDGGDLEARVLYGRNVFAKPMKLFAAVEAGYRRRFGDAADQVRIDALVGAEPSKRLLFLVEAFATVSLRNEAPNGADYDVVKLQPSAVWRFSPRLALQAGVTHEIGGRNLILGDTYFVGVWTSF